MLQDDAVVRVTSTAICGYSSFYCWHILSTEAALSEMWSQNINWAHVPKQGISSINVSIISLPETKEVSRSDLHMYVGSLPGMEKGDILGHEWMGFVEEVGPGVKNINKGRAWFLLVLFKAPDT